MRGLFRIGNGDLKTGASVAVGGHVGVLGQKRFALALLRHDAAHPSAAFFIANFLAAGQVRILQAAFDVDKLGCLIAWSRFVEVGLYFFRLLAFAWSSGKVRCA